MPHALAVALTVVLGSAGGVLFHLLGAPAAFLTGSAVAVTIAVVLGVPTRLPDWLRSPSLALIGVIMGTSVSPDALQDVSALPVGAMGVALATVCAGAASYLVLRHWARWDPLTALCGSIPGAFALVLALADSHGARMERVVTSQALRLFILVSLIPLVFGTSESASLPPPESAGDVITDLLVAFAIALGSWALAQRIRVPAAIMIVPLMLTALLSGSGLISLALPSWLAAAAFTVLGASVAARFRSVTRHEVARLAGASLAAFAAAFAAAMSLAFLFSLIIDEPLGAVFLAFAPGGVDAMIALSFLLGFDVTFVTVMHVARLMMLSAVSPFLVTHFDKAGKTGLGPGSRAR